MMKFPFVIHVFFPVALWVNHTIWLGAYALQELSLHTSFEPTPGTQALARSIILCRFYESNIGSGLLSLAD